MNSEQINNQCLQTMRQLGEGDITLQKATMRLLKMTAALTRPVRVYFHLGTGAFMPEKAHSDDAAWDLRSSEDTSLKPGETKRVCTGVHIALPTGYEAQVRPRSGLASSGITILNSPGTIDAGYRGELQIILHNTKDSSFLIGKGDRIAQLLIAQLPEVDFMEAADNEWERMSSTTRGTGGFGSTGVK